MIDRLKLLFQGKFWAFWHYNELGFTTLTYRGKPVILRDDIPRGELWGVKMSKNGRIKIIKKVKLPRHFSDTDIE